MLVLQAGLSFGQTLPIFSRNKNLKVYKGAYGFFLQAQTPTRTKKDRGNCYGYMWREGYFNGQVLLWAEPSPFFRGKKYYGANGHFLLCDAILVEHRLVIDGWTDRDTHAHGQHISRSHSVAR